MVSDAFKSAAVYPAKFQYSEACDGRVRVTDIRCWRQALQGCFPSVQMSSTPWRDVSGATDKSIFGFNLGEDSENAD
jgi:hypothetical protein